MVGASGAHRGQKRRVWSRLGAKLLNVSLKIEQLPQSGWPGAGTVSRPPSGVLAPLVNAADY